MRKNILIILTVMILTTSLLTSCDIGKRGDSSTANSKTAKIDSSATVPSTNENTTQLKNITTSESASAEGFEWTAVLYYPDEDLQYVIKTEKKFIYTDKDKEPDTEEKAKTVLEELINNQNSAIPKGTKILSVVYDDDNNMITVDFSKEFEKNMNGGSTAINMMMSQIVLSLTELDGVDRVSIRIDGEVVKEYKGHIELDLPFTRDEYIDFIDKNM